MNREKITIYGASDDLIEIEGVISEEIDCYGICEKGIKISCSDGTKGKITYGEKGEWEIELDHTGDGYIKLIRSTGDEGEHVDELAKGCTSYSDVLVLKPWIDWVKIGRKTFNRS